VREGDNRKISRAKCWLLSPSKLSLLFEFRREIEKKVWKDFKIGFKQHFNKTEFVSNNFQVFANIRL
jgi:hypothetical protein